VNTWPRAIGILLALCLLCVGAVTASGEVIEASIEHSEDHYLIHLDMRIQGKAADVYRVLIDFNHLNRINDSITSSRELENEGEVHRVRVVVRGCVWIFCRSLTQLQTVTELSGGYLMSITAPSKTDLRYGHVLWQIIDEGSTTRIKYNADFVPAFWVPPLIGPLIFKHRLLEEGQKTVNGIERLLNPQQP
jgi:hypothetical protein